MSENIILLPENEHWYESPTKKGVYYPSVTMVNQMPKGKYFDKYMAEQESYEDAQRILREAGERGTRVHKASEVLQGGGKITYGQPHEYYGHLNRDEYILLVGYVAWYKKYQPTCIHSELALISDKLKLGGTTDRVYMIDGRKVLWDLKTSKSAIYPYHITQAAAYAEMYEMLMKEQIDDIAILRVTSQRKCGYEYLVRSRKEWKKDFKQFLRNYETFKYLSGEAKKIEPKIVEIPAILSLE